MYRRPDGARIAWVLFTSMAIACGVDAIFLVVIFDLIIHTIKTTITKVFKSVIQYYTRELYMDNVHKYD